MCIVNMSFSFRPQHFDFRRGLKTGEFGLTETFGGNTESIREANREILNQEERRIANELGLDNNQGSSGTGDDTTKDTNSGVIQGTTDGFGTDTTTNTSGGGDGDGKTTEEKEQDRLEQQRREVENVFSEAQNLLDRREQTLRASRPDLLSSVRQQFESQIPQLRQARDQGLSAVDTAKTQTKRQSQSALDSARRLFNELGQRNDALIGNQALTSAGQAASEILGREQQRNFGRIRQNTADTLQNLQKEARNVQEKFNTRLQALEARKQAALAEARNQFRNRLDAINRQRGELAGKKGVAQLQALRDYRNQLRQIDAEERQFRRQIQALKEQEASNIRQALAQQQIDAGNAQRASQALYGDAAAGNQQAAGNFTTGVGTGNNADALSFLLTGQRTNREEEDRTRPSNVLQAVNQYNA